MTNDEKSEEATNLRGLAAQRDKLARIKELHRGGMSRARLIQTYGRDLVHLALSGN
jgi:hypothetical protein